MPWFTLASLQLELNRFSLFTQIVNEADNKQHVKVGAMVLAEYQ